MRPSHPMQVRPINVHPMHVLVLVLAAAAASVAQARELNGFDLDGSLIPVRDIESGGPPRDGIPSIDNPAFVAASDAAFLDAEDRILGVTIEGQPKAYPIAILNWHEIVNDQSAGQHFVVTYCPLCGTGMVFATNAGAHALNFGVSGLLYNSDVLLYDRNTDSLWSQLLAKAISGPLKGTVLPQLPAHHTSWAAWRGEHPDTLVLSRDTGFRRDYARSPYRGYERSARLYFDVANKAPNDYHPKALVLGVASDGAYKAYPFEELQAAGRQRIPDRVGEQDLFVVWNEAATSAHAEAPDGGMLPATVSYWFAWYAFYPETDVFKGE